MAAGCKKQETAASKAAPTPAPVAKFHIKPPVSFSSDKIPQTGVSEFTVQGSADQLLHVSGDQKSRDDRPYSLSVQTEGGSELKEGERGDKCFGEPLFLLPKTGDYRVLFDPSGVKHTLDFALLAGNDPLVDPSLRPDQVSVDLGKLADDSRPGSSSPTEMCLGDAWPAHVVIANGFVTIRILQIVGYNKFFPGEAGMSRLAASLKPGAITPNPTKLPHASYDRKDDFIAIRPELFTGQGWRGRRWIEVAYRNGDYDAGPMYVFEGLTDDGQFFVWMYANVTHPEFERMRPTEEQDDEKVKKKEAQSLLLLKKSLAAASPSSFSPNLDDLDAVIRSLKIKR